MENLIFGIPTVLLSAITFLFAWKYAFKEQYRLAVLLTIIGGLALRLFTSADFYLHEWDEEYHALVAKNMIDQPLKPMLYEDPMLDYNFKDWTANHIWVHKQPVPLWTMAASMWLFGVNEIALRLPSIIFTSIGIWLVFVVGSYFFDRRSAYIAALLFAINGLIIELAAGRVATDHIDVFFLFFVLLAVYFSVVFVQRQKTVFNVLAGISIGAAILSKWLPALIVLPIWYLVVSDSRNFSLKEMAWQFGLLVGTCVLIALPWQIYIHQAFPAEAQWESAMNLKHLTETLDGRSEPFYYFLTQIRINYGELIYLPLLWFMWRYFKNWRDKKALALLLWFVVPLVFFSIAETKMQGYLLFTSPALFLITGAFWTMLKDYRRQHKPRWLYTLLLVAMIALPVRYAIERIKPFQQIDRSPEWVADLKELDAQNIENGVLFNYHRPIAAMFYTDLTVYYGIPHKAIIEDLNRKGYRVLVNQSGDLPAKVRSLEGVTFVGLSMPVQ